MLMHEIQANTPLYLSIFTSSGFKTAEHRRKQRFSPQFSKLKYKCFFHLCSCGPYEYKASFSELQMVWKLLASTEQTPPWASLVMLSNARCIFYVGAGTNHQRCRAERGCPLWRPTTTSRAHSKQMAVMMCGAIECARLAVSDRPPWFEEFSHESRCRMDGYIKVSLYRKTFAAA